MDASTLKLQRQDRNMAARAEQLEPHRLFTEFSEHAYSDESVVHRMHKSGLSVTWKRVKEVGSGAFGTIWQEQDEAGELRAVKCLPKAIYKIDFMREVHTLAELRSHPEQFVHFLGWFEDKHFIFIAMEYTECGDLRKYIQDSQPKARREVRQITGQILEGLEILHRKNICHRDLNPQNILIASFSPIWVKIADFGVSKREIDTQLRTHCGTPGYRAPEQQGILPRKIKSGNAYTNAADLWALGCIVHEILTSEIPFLCEADSGTTISGLEEMGQELDTMLLFTYCQGSIQFPTKGLEDSMVGKEGIDFVKRLLAVDPRCRMSASDALRSPWLSEKNDSETLRDQFSCLGIHISLETADYLIVQTNSTYTMQALVGGMKDVNMIRHTSASNGYFLFVKFLLGIINSIDFKINGITTLQLATKGGHPEVVELLLGVISGYVTPGILWAAAASGSFDIVKLFLEHGANVNTRTYLGSGDRSKKSQSALEVAVEGGHHSVAQLLLQRKADVNFIPINDHDQTVLWAAAVAGHLGLIKLLLDSGADVDARPRFRVSGLEGWFHGQTALQAVAANGRSNLVQLLLYRGADVNAKPAYAKGRTALQAAAEGGHLDVVKLLLNAGAEVNAGPSHDSGRTALQATAGAGHLDVVKLLLNAGAEVNAKPSTLRGLTALQTVAEGGHLDMVKLLLNVGAEVNAGPGYDNGRTALQAAAEGGRLDVVKLLLSAGAEVNAKPSTFWGLTALQTAAKGGHLDVVKLLLNAGAEVNAGPGRSTVLKLAEKSGNAKVVKLLLDYDTDILMGMFFGAL